VFICDIKYYEEIQLILSQIFGFGILMVCKELYLAIKYKACLYTPIACVGLLLLNIVNVIFLSFNLYYKDTIQDENVLKVALERCNEVGTLYDKIVIVIFFIFSTIFLVKKNYEAIRSKN
jgi:hypothetical protein